MKLRLIPILLTLALGSSALAVSFDTEGFGSRLNGWKKDRTASYAFTDAKYRTHVPTITYSPSGAMFLSTQVDMLALAGKGAICHIDMTFSAGGQLEGVQIKGLINNKAIDTGLVRRPEAPALEPVVEGATAAPPRPFHPTDEMIAELFIQFDAQMKKVTEAKEGWRSDLSSRLSGNTVKSADLSAGLRHNLNLMLQHVN
jgi:hypothetical protein